MQDRAERRYLTEKVAKDRHSRWPNTGQEVGWFRKWNGSCDCRWCQIAKVGDIAHQRMKDERRNLLVD